MVIYGKFKKNYFNVKNEHLPHSVVFHKKKLGTRDHDDSNKAI